jgi:hypothetical protein
VPRPASSIILKNENQLLFLKIIGLLLNLKNLKIEKKLYICSLQLMNVSFISLVFDSSSKIIKFDSLSLMFATILN